MNISENVRMVKKHTSSHIVVLIIAISIQLLPLQVDSQSINAMNSIEAIIDSVQKIYGSNDQLVNGKVYYQPNRLAIGTPFLFSSQFNKGTVYTQGLSFNVVGLNYNIVDHELILLNITPDGAKLHIKLSDVLVDSFLLNNYLFVVPKKLNIKSNYPYMLAVNDGQHRMLIGYNNEFINRFTQSNPYGKFGSTKQSLFLVHDSTLLQVNSKKTFLKTMPSAKKEISSFLKQHKIKLLKATPDQLKQLMEFYNNQMNNTDE